MIGLLLLIGALSGTSFAIGFIRGHETGLAEGRALTRMRDAFSSEPAARGRATWRRP